MVSTTLYRTNTPLARRLAVLTLCGVMAFGLAALAAGCASKTTGSTKTSEATASDEPKGYGMGGVAQDIAILATTIADRPAPWDLSTPESAVRSYLDWVSYAYRIADSEVATPTQTPYQVVRTDAYNQMQLQEQRLLDQRIASITFGKVSVEGTHTVVPAKEQWRYRYVSIKEAGKTVKGPFTASYETTYTLVKDKDGWKVDDIDVKAIGTIK